MTDFSFGFTEGSFFLLKCQKHLRSVAKGLISNPGGHSVVKNAGGGGA